MKAARARPGSARTLAEQIGIQAGKTYIHYMATESKNFLRKAENLWLGWGPWIALMLLVVYLVLS